MKNTVYKTPCGRVTLVLLGNQFRVAVPSAGVVNWFKLGQLRQALANYDALAAQYAG